jgi:hypothetical protein
MLKEILQKRSETKAICERAETELYVGRTDALAGQVQRRWRRIKLDRFAAPQERAAILAFPHSLLLYHFLTWHTSAGRRISTHTKDHSQSDLNQSNSRRPTSKDVARARLIAHRLACGQSALPEYVK